MSHATRSAGGWLRRAALAAATAAALVLGAGLASPASATDAEGAAATGSVSGTVTDSTGAGVETYVALWAKNGDWSGGTISDGQGVFALDSIAPGSYTLAFYSQSGDYLVQWYSGKPTQQTADYFDVKSGKATTGRNAVLVRASHISGVMTDADGKPLSGAAVVYAANRSSDTESAVVGFTRVGSDGSYSVPGLPQGDYKVGFTTYSSGTTQSGALAPSDPYVSQWYDEKYSYATASTVSITDPGQTVTGIDAALQNPKFADASDPTAVFYPYIQWMGTSGLSNGSVNPAGGKPLFLPVDPVTRQAFAAFLYRYSKETFTPPQNPTFADVTAANPFYTAIEWMAAKGISTGSINPAGGKPLFEPGANISRQATAAFLGRYAKIPNTPPQTQVFADVPNNATFANAIDWMGDNKISTGSPNPAGGLPLFKPVDNVTRQEIAAFLYRYNNLLLG